MVDARRGRKPRTSAPEEIGPRLVVGRVRGLHGLNGAVRVEVLSDDESRFGEGSRVFAEGSTRSLTVTWVQPDVPGLLVRFREVPSRQVAESLREVYLEIDRPADGLADGEAYWHEVIGVPVTTAAGERLGTIADVFRAGESEVYVVSGGARGEILVPAVRGVVTVFEPAAGRIEVDGGALGLDDEPPPRRARGRRSSRLPRGVVPERIEESAGAAEPATPAEPETSAPAADPEG